MNTVRRKVTTVQKEMGLTHMEFYDGLPNLLNDIPVEQTNDTIKFQFKGKKIEVILAAERAREIGPSVQLAVTLVTLKFFDFSEEEVWGFIERFNLKFMKGGG